MWFSVLWPFRRPDVRRIVCLANSRKLSGRCVAGREWTQAGAGPWIRPVGLRRTGELAIGSVRYKGGGEPRLLDLIDIPLFDPRPHTYQSENTSLAPWRAWRYGGRLNWDDLPGLAEQPETLWLHDRSDEPGMNNRVAEEEAAELSNSLYLLHLDRLELQVVTSREPSGHTRRRVHAVFHYGGVRYRMSVTDPVVERRFRTRMEGRYPVGACHATVSLGEPHQGYCYKLVAAIMTPDLLSDDSAGAASEEMG